MFLLHTSICALAILLNYNTNRKKVAIICFITMLGAIIISPIFPYIDPIVSYAILSLLTVIALNYIPMVNRYELIKIILWLSLILYLFCATIVNTTLYDDVPYTLVVNILNTLQSLILLGGSDVIYNKLRNRFSADIGNRV